MAWNPRAGSGAYDSLLRAFYSVLCFLERQQKAQYMRYAAINFSGTTLKTPWKTYAEIAEIKKLLFRRQGGGTVFDPTSLDRLVQVSNDSVFSLMVTDGQIKNADAVLERAVAMTANGHHFVLIQIGKETPLVTQLREESLPVHMIADHKELEGLCLQYSRKTWGKGENE